MSLYQNNGGEGAKWKEYKDHFEQRSSENGKLPERENVTMKARTFSLIL